MRMPPMTTRRWMVAVAVLALALAADDWRGRRSRYLRLAADHASEEVRLLRIRRAGHSFVPGMVLYSDRYSSRSPERFHVISPAAFDAKIAHLGRLKEKYQFAAAHPWWPVPSDPPPPEP